jgi:hypothetical protein
VSKLRLVQGPAADALLDDNPFALLVGMLLDQRKSIRIDIYRGQTFRAVMS